MEALGSLTDEPLESSLAQQIQALYVRLLGHQPSRVTCQLLDLRLFILLEEGITRPEQFLLEDGREELVQQVRSSLNEVIQRQLKKLVETATQVTVVDLLNAAQLETGRVSFIALLEHRPEGYQSDSGQLDLGQFDSRSGSTQDDLTQTSSTQNEDGQADRQADE